MREPIIGFPFLIYFKIIVEFAWQSLFYALSLDYQEIEKGFYMFIRNNYKLLIALLSGKTLYKNNMHYSLTLVGHYICTIDDIKSGVISSMEFTDIEKVLQYCKDNGFRYID